MNCKELIRTPKVEEDVKHEAVTKADHNIINNFENLSAWLEGLSYGDLETVENCILNNLGFLFYIPDNDAEVGIMFEVINNRGKPLSQLEKIKNYLIYYAEKKELSDLKGKVRESWPRILERLSRADVTEIEEEDAFLRNCWIVFHNQYKKKSYHVYENLKAEWNVENKSGNDWRKLLDFIEFMAGAAFTYNRLFNGEGKNDTERTWLKRIKHHDQNASILPLLLAIFEKVPENERAEILELIEKLNFRYYVTGIANRSDSGQGVLFGIAHKIYNQWNQKIEQNDDVVTVDEKWIKRRLKSFVENHANDKKFVKALTLDKDESGDMYDQHGLKFFLASYEEKLKDDHGESMDLDDTLARQNKVNHNDFYHIEHIWAIEDKTLGLDEDRELDINKRRLANFVLLKPTINISVSNKPPGEKIELYFKDTENHPNTIMIRELKKWYRKAYDYYDKNVYDRKSKYFWYNVYQYFLDLRQQRLTNFALERWSVEGVSNPITNVKINSFTDKNEIFEVEY